MKPFAYESYAGPEPFLCLLCHESNGNDGAALGNELAGRNVRVFLGTTGTKELLPEELSGAILNANGVIILLKEGAVDHLEFRNAVNYAMALKKPALVVKAPDYVPGHGLDMQLANVDTVPEGGARSVADGIDRLGMLSNAVTGEGMIRKAVPVRRYLVTAALFLVGIGLVVGSVFVIKNRVAYYNSPEYLFQNLDNCEYLDVSSYGRAGIDALAGKWVRELSARNMGLKAVDEFALIDMEVLDLTGNPDIESFEPLLHCPNLYLVRISQAAAEKAKVFRDHGKTVEITE